MKSNIKLKKKKQHRNWKDARGMDKKKKKKKKEGAGEENIKKIEAR